MTYNLIIDVNSKSIETSFKKKSNSVCKPMLIDYALQTFQPNWYHYDWITLDG